MTIPTYSGLGTALSGLEAMQAGIDTTSENISNASNPDYADESVNLVTNPSLTFYTGQGNNAPVELGTGVGIESISRNDSAFVDGQYWTANAGSSYYSTLSSQLSDTEQDLNTSSTSGLQSALSNFYQAVDGLANSAGGTTAASAATAVVGQAQALAQQLNTASQQISSLQSQAQDQVTSLTSSGGELDQYATDIANLNAQIAAQSAAGLSSNSLEDQRATVIDKLSALASINVTQQKNGSDTITLMNTSTTPPTQVGSSPLVDGGNGTSVPAVSSAVTLPASSDLTSVGGEIGALAQLADTNASDPGASLAQMQQQLNSMVSNSSGTGLADIVNSAAGAPIFTTSDGTSTITAANISVDSSAGTTLAGLTSTQANAVYATSTQANTNLATFVSQVGNTAAQASDSSSTASSLLTNIYNQRQSVSGVSLDQEMTNLITYQQGYQASARVMSTMQNVIQTLISSVGGAGV